MDCSDHIVLQRLLDSELDEAQAELVSYHLASCAQCRAVTKHLTAVRRFVEDRLGAEDEAEEDAAALSLAAVARRLPIPRKAPWTASVRLRRTWMAAAAVAIVALLLPGAFDSRVSASPEEILEEAVARERIWSYQADKVLKWEVETSSSGIKGLADGRWQTLFWQKNGASTFAQITRQIDPQGRTVRASWRQDDGSIVTYRSSASDVVEISPSIDVAREALPALSPELRDALQSYLDRRESRWSLDAQSRREAERLNRPAVGTSRGTATLRRGTVAEWGEVYHITVVDTRRAQSPSILQAVHEYDVEKSSYRLLRLKSTLRYADGTTGVHDSRWVAYGETSAADFAAHIPLDVLEGRRLVRLTPLEVATRHLQELNRVRTSPN